MNQIFCPFWTCFFWIVKFPTMFKCTVAASFLSLACLLTWSLSKSYTKPHKCYVPVIQYNVVVSTLEDGDSITSALLLFYLFFLISQFIYLFMISVQLFGSNSKACEVTTTESYMTGCNDTKVWLVPADVTSLLSCGVVCEGKKGLSYCLKREQEDI